MLSTTPHANHAVNGTVAISQGIRLSRGDKQTADRTLASDNQTAKLTLPRHKNLIQIVAAVSPRLSRYSDRRAGKDQNCAHILGHCADIQAVAEREQGLVSTEYGDRTKHSQPHGRVP